MSVMLPFFLRLINRKKKAALLKRAGKANRFGERKNGMSKMCTLGSSCAAHKGMCIHEKIMVGMMVVAVIAGLIYWLF